MNKFIRIYNQNRVEIWIGILIIIFIFAMIQLFNNNAKQSLEAKSNNMQNELKLDNDEDTYEKQSEALLSGDSNLSSNTQKEYGQLIDSFLSSCVSENLDNAYSMLSKDCIELLYPTINEFKENYWKDKFEKHKKYEFQLWSALKADIYLVKINDDILSTGQIGDSKSYIQEYITIVKENGEYKLNINSFIKKVNRDKKKVENGISIYVKDSYIFMDYEIYNLSVTNTNGDRLVIDSKEKLNTSYVTTSEGADIEAMLFENLDEDLEVEYGETKDIQIKFSNSYQEKSSIDKLTFSDINIIYNLNNEKRIISMSIDL